MRDGRAGKAAKTGGRIISRRGREIELPLADNCAEALHTCRAAKRRFREVPWPALYDHTCHQLISGSVRLLASVADETVHLTATSSPYAALKEYSKNPDKNELIVFPPAGVTAQS